MRQELTEKCPKCNSIGHVESYLDSIDYDKDEGVEIRNVVYCCKKCKHEWDSQE